MRMHVLEVEVMAFRVLSRVPALLTDVQLVPALLVGKAVVEVVHLAAVRLQGASLGEGLLTHVTLVGSHT